MIPRMAILDAHDNVLGFIDNSTPKGAHIYDTLFHLYLAGSAYTLSFKALTKDDPDCILVAGNKLAFRYGIEDYYLNIVSVERSEWEISVEAYGLSFELLNEEVTAFECPDPWTFQDYVNHFQAESDLKVTVNEVQEKRIKLSWDGRDTILKRLFSVANSFEAELAFKAKLNNHWGLDHIELEVRRRIGEDRFNPPIRYGQNLHSVKKTIDIVDIYTALYPIGKDGLTLNGFQHSPEDDGIFLDGPVLRSPRQRDLFPAMHISSDSFIMKYWDCDVDSQAMLYGRALAELRKNSVPKASYEISGTFDLMPGDRVRIIDDQYSPPLILDARAVEVEICFEDPAKCKTVFDNFTEVSSMLSSDILQTVQDMWNEQKVYQVSITASDGVIFKNGSGSTTLTAKVLEKGLDIVDQFDLKWLVNEDEKSTENDFEITADEINQKASVRVEIWKNGKIRGMAEVTLTDVSDGAKGDPGKDAQDVLLLSVVSSNGFLFKNEEINTVLTCEVYRGSQRLTDAQVTALGALNWYKNGESAHSASGKSLTVNESNSVSYEVVLETVEKPLTARLNADLVRVDDGETGPVGPAGADGHDVTATVSKANGVATVTITDKDGTKTFTISDGQDGADGVAGTPGTDGQTPYTHFAWADSADGSTNFSTTNSTGKLYMGVYSDYTQADSTDKTKYKWTKIKGETGSQGPAGADGKDVTASVSKANGVATVTLTDKNGTKTFTISDGQDGADGVAGTPGIDGKTPYTHFAWANSSDGSTDFSTTVSAGKTYMGVYSDFTQADSTDKTKYKWTKIKGETGADGKDVTASVTKTNGTATVTITDKNGTKTFTISDGQDGATGQPGTPGADGKTPYTHFAWADSSDGTSNFSVTNSTGKLYIGVCSNFIQADPTTPSSYKWTKIKGDPGSTGPAGASITKSYEKIEYVLSTSGSVKPTSGWSTNIPTLVPERYLWTRTTITWSDNSKTETISVGYLGKNGLDGAKGDKGDPGSTGPAGPKGDTGATGPKGDPGKDAQDVLLLSVVSSNGFLFKNEEINTVLTCEVYRGSQRLTDAQVTALGALNWYKNGESAHSASGKSLTVNESNSVSYEVVLETVEKPLTARLNADLVRVDDGETGPVGPAGADGHDVTATVTKANGVATIQITDKDGTKTFTISDGEDGADGVAGPAGSDGQTSYTHFAWANSSDGTTGFSTTVSAGKTYMGVCTNFTQADPTTASSYKWTKIKGETGETGPKGDPGVQGIQGVPGQNGQDGAKGDKGDTGKGVSNVKPQYYLSSSNTSQSGSTWTYTYPSFNKAKYLFTRFEITWTDNSKTYTDAVVDEQWIKMSGMDDTITQQGNTIALKADQSTVSTLTGRVSANESAITSLGNRITLEVNQLEGRMDTECDYSMVINQSDAGSGKIKLTASVFSKGKELSESQIIALGALNWFKSSSAPLASGKSVTVDVSDREFVHCKLEV